MQQVIFYFQRMIISLNFDAHVRNISSLDASIVTTFTIGIALELPADLLVAWSLDLFGRRWSTAGSMILSSMATLLCAILHGNFSAFLWRILPLSSGDYRCWSHHGSFVNKGQGPNLGLSGG